MVFESQLDHSISPAAAEIIHSFVRFVVRSFVHSFIHAFNHAFMHCTQAHGPFLFISPIGTHPEQQSLGLGSRVLKEVTSIADEHGQHCYLEVSIWGTILHGKRNLQRDS